MGESNPSTYKLTGTDAANNKLMVEVTDEEGTNPGTATVEDDKLTLEKEGDDPMILLRIDKAEFDKRLEAGKKAVEAFKAGLGGGAPGGGGPGGGGTPPGIPPVPTPTP